MSAIPGLLPDYTRPDLGFERQVNAMTPGGALIRSFTVPGAFWVRVLSLHIAITTNATVATRIPVGQIVDTPGIAAGNFIAIVPAPSGQAASITTDYTWFPTAGSAVGVLSGIQYAPWPDFYIPSGYSIRASIGTGQAGDNIVAFDLFLQMIPTGPEAIGVAATRPFDASQLGLVQSSDFVSSSNGDFLTAPTEFPLTSISEVEPVTVPIEPAPE